MGRPASDLDDYLEWQQRLEYVSGQVTRVPGVTTTYFVPDIANHVPQKDTWRMTLTWPVITQGREVAFLIEGAAKAEILHTVMQGKYDPETYPAQLIRPASGKLTLLLDTAAAADLPAGTRNARHRSTRRAS